MRIIEAVLAIVLVLSALVIMVSQRELPKSRDLSENIPSILDEIAKNSSFREKIIKEYNLSLDYTAYSNRNILNELEEFSRNRINNPSFELVVRICNLEYCHLEPYPLNAEEIFASERVISTTIEESSFNPKKVKIFIWRKT